MLLWRFWPPAWGHTVVRGGARVKLWPSDLRVTASHTLQPSLPLLRGLWKLLCRRIILNLRHEFHLAGPVVVIFIFDNFLLKYFPKCHCLRRSKAEVKVWEASDGVQESSKFRARRLGRAQIFCSWGMSLLLLICHCVSREVVRSTPAPVSVYSVSLFLILGSAILYYFLNTILKIRVTFTPFRTHESFCRRVSAL